jgi:hypothetical protein
MATTTWLISFDTDVKIARADFHPWWCIPFMTTAGEVSFAGMRTPTKPAFKLVLKENRAYFRLRQPYHFPRKKKAAVPVRAHKSVPQKNRSR